MSLERLAARFGVARSYRSDRGERVEVGRETVIGVLVALGVDTTGRGWITRALAEQRAHEAARLVEPVLVAWDGVLDARMPPDATDVHLPLEDGSSAALDLDREHGAVRTAGRLPFGYHRLEVAAGSRAATALVISAPRRTWSLPDDGRHWGVYAPLFALHHGGASGPGDLRDLAMLLEWVASHGGDTLITLPLLASFLDEPQEISPYSPVSRLMWNELYAVVDRTRATTGGELIDYRTAADATRAGVLAEVDALDRDPIGGADLLRFLAERPEVADYARFRAAQARHGRNWRAWPAALRDGDIGPTDTDPREVRYHVVAQWLTDRQLGELGRDARAHGRLLGLDLAIGTHPDGYDVWRHRDVFARGANAGAPPDTFFVGGQDWGFPPIVPAVARATGHDYFRRALAHHLRHATLLRIDHVMCLDRLYWVPHGAAPTDGTYVSYPIDELFAIATLEAHRARALVIGEDLGTVPPAIRHAMARHGLLGTWVAQGALEDVARHGDFARPPRRSVAALNTHDMPTFAGFLAGTDIDDRAALGQIDDAAAKRQHATRAELVHATQRLLDAGDERELLARLVEDLGASDAELVLVNLEDLWLEPRPHNVPGTYRERPNWRRPAAFGVDRLDDVPGVGAVLERLAAARRGTASTAPTI